MCDTVVAIRSDGVLFAKNSDRDPNEAQLVEWRPAARHRRGERVRCTWIEVPQAPSTRAVVLSRPWWMWGAEMGANDAGVVAGNEAVFTTEPNGEPALLGMDLLRLALERASSAHEAVGTIVELLERYGQGGPCSNERPGFTYHNSFLVADPTGAIVLETAGRHWAVEEVRTASRAISNGLTIPGFAARHASKFRERVVSCATRRALTEHAAGAADGPLAMMAALREHGTGAGPAWSAISGALRAPCAHAGGLLVSTQTTSAMVADLRGSPLHWMTATAAPCTSIFKPVRVGEPVSLSEATDRFDPRSTWWAHEPLHRGMVRHWERWHGAFAAERDSLERAWMSCPPSTAEALDVAGELEARWLAALDPHDDQRPWWVRTEWRRHDERAQMPWTRPRPGPASDGTAGARDCGADASGAT